MRVDRHRGLTNDTSYAFQVAAVMAATPFAAALLADGRVHTGSALTS